MLPRCKSCDLTDGVAFAVTVTDGITSPSIVSALGVKEKLARRSEKAHSFAPVKRRESRRTPAVKRRNSFLPSMIIALYFFMLCASGLSLWFFFYFMSHRRRLELFDKNEKGTAGIIPCRAEHVEKPYFAKNFILI